MPFPRKSRREFLKKSSIMGPFAVLFPSLFMKKAASYPSYGKICIVFDDAGASNLSPKLIEMLANEDVPATFSVMPHSIRQKDVLSILSQYKSADILLHQQMEPIEKESHTCSNR